MQWSETIMLDELRSREDRQKSQIQKYYQIEAFWETKKEQPKTQNICHVYFYML